MENETLGQITDTLAQAYILNAIEFKFPFPVSTVNPHSYLKNQTGGDNTWVQSSGWWDQYEHNLCNKFRYHETT